MMVETETLELKKSLLELKEGIISLSAMLNKTHNGNVIFGINDEGEIKGVTIGTKTKADITHEIQNEQSHYQLQLTSVKKILMENQ